jgi:hypothetical protein
MVAIGLAQGKSATQAHRDAGFSESTSNASTLSRRPEVQARVAELIEERTQFKGNIAKNSEFETMAAMEQAFVEQDPDRGWIITQLMENALKSRELGQFSASNKALELLGREIGMFEQKKLLSDDGKKKGGDDGDPGNRPVSVDAINHLLAQAGYQGPPIDLTKKRTPVPAVVPVDSGSPVAE